MRINYFEILKTSLSDIWNNKILWIFGFFVALGSSSSSWLNFNFSNEEFSDKEALNSSIAIINQNRELILLVTIAVVILVIAVFFLRIIGQAAIISSIGIKRDIERSFTSLFKRGLKSLKRLAALDVILFCAALFLWALFILPPAYLFYKGSLLLGIVVTIMAAVIALPVMLIIIFWRRYSYFYVVLGKLSITSSIERAYLLLRSKFIDTIVFSIIIIIIEMIISIATLALIVAVLVSFVPIMFIAGVNVSDINNSINLWMLMAAGVIAFLIIISITSILAAYREVAWTNFFKEVTGQRKKEELESKEEMSKKEVPSPQVL